MSNQAEANRDGVITHNITISINSNTDNFDDEQLSAIKCGEYLYPYQQKQALWVLRNTDVTS